MRGGFRSVVALCLGASALALVGASAARAQSTWQGTTTDYGTPTNWSPNIVPGAPGQSAIFAGTGISFVNLSSTESPDSWTFSSSSQSYTFTNGTVSFGGTGLVDSASGQTITILTNVTGVGGVAVHDATGRLILGGANSYSGPTTIDSGAGLQIGNNGTSGTLGTAGVTDNGTLFFNRADIFTVANVISGTGALIQLGPGTLILSSADTYSGGTTVRGGTLQVTGAGTLGAASGSVTVLSTLDLGGTTQIQNGGVTLLSGTIQNGTLSSSGTFILNSGTVSATLAGTGSVSGGGGGTTIVSGNNTYSGGTTITAGALQVGNGGTSGSLGTGGVVDNGALVFNRSDNFTMSGSVSGSGSLTQAGTGTLVLDASNTYSGTTTINKGGTLQVGFGGTNGTLGSGNVINNGMLAINHADNVNLGNAISGSGGGLTQMGSGILTLSGANTYSGGTTITGGGTLKIAGSGTLGANADIINGINPGGIVTVGYGTLDLGGTTQNVVGLMLNSGTIQNGTLWSEYAKLLGQGTVSAILAGPGFVQAFDAHSTGVILSGANTYTGGTLISGGPVTISGAGTLGAASGSLTVKGGPLDLGGTTQIQNGGVSILTGSIVQNGTLSSSGTFTFQFAHVDVSLAGTGQVLVGGGGLAPIFGITRPDTVFSFVNTYTGPTVIQAADAVLALVGAGSIANSSSVTVSQGGTLDIQGVSGAGTSIISLSGDGQVGLGAKTLTLTNASGNFSGVISGTGGLTLRGGSETLSGANTYSGGTTISAGTLTVTGSLAGPVTVSGGTLNGTGRVGATSVATGSTLNPGSGTTPGTLSVMGNLTLASGANYLDVVTPTAAGLTGVSGAATINGTVTTNFTGGAYPPAQRYTILSATGGVSGTFASLTGIPAGLKAQLSYDTNNVYLNLIPNTLAPILSNPTGNQHSVASAIDAAVSAGNLPPAGFAPLYSLSGPALNSALGQISGQTAGNVTNAVGQGFLSFLSMTGEGGSSETGNFAPGSAYGGADAPHRAQLGTGETRVWGAVYGGHVGLSGDAASGAPGLTSNNVGLIGGADRRFADNFLAGVTLGLGQQQFHSGNDHGDSHDVMIGVYGRLDAGAAYVAASFGYGWHHIKTLRIVTVSGIDMLQGKQNADDVGGRIEAGWRLPLDETTSVIPYGAFAGDSFESPAYSESAVSGASTFALAYGAQTTSLGRSELGAHLERGYALEHGMLTADVRAAWAHQLDDLPFTQASFLNLPGAAFQTAGIRPGRETALLGLDLEVQNSSGLFFGLKGESQLGAGTTVLEGLGNFGWRW
ncbi:MAG TPA: autotransporter domain-containing protein [Rhizomicrobium sp.]|nr:autotransporter domain-containing protein [Rhizomicrobium sp.]